MGFNRAERLVIWTGLLRTAQASLASVDADFPGVDASLVSRIRSNREHSVRECQKNVDFYTD